MQYTNTHVGFRYEDNKCNDISNIDNCKCHYSENNILLINELYVSI